MSRKGWIAYLAFAIAASVFQSVLLLTASARGVGSGWVAVDAICLCIDLFWVAVAVRYVRRATS